MLYKIHLSLRDRASSAAICLDVVYAGVNTTQDQEQIYLSVIQNCLCLPALWACICVAMMGQAMMGQVNALQTVLI